MANTIYRMWQNGSWNHPTLPPIIPDSQPPVTPQGDLWYGTTVFGSSHSRYKVQTIGSNSNRFAALENNITYNGHNGVAVNRMYGGPGNGAQTWSQAKPAYLRDGVPMIYSWMEQSVSQTESAFKQDLRDFLDTKPTNSDRCWLAYFHEPDDNIAKGEFTQQHWIDRNAQVREVLNETAYSSRTDIRFGNIFVASVFLSYTKGTWRWWETFWDMMTATWGSSAANVWDFMGADHYNTQWKDTSVRYPKVDDWLNNKDICNNKTGLPFLIGEGGTPRASWPNHTLAQRETERATWINDLCSAIRDRGYFDAFCWWNEPKVKGDITEQFSTVQICETGYDATLDPPSLIPAGGGYDAQETLDTYSKFCIESAALATPTIPYR